jgi:hypothetical protein
VAEEPPSRRFEGDRGQRAAQIRLMEPAQPQAGRSGVLAEPVQRELVGRRENDESVGMLVPRRNHVVVGDGEVECGVNRLTCLRSRRQISTGNDVEGR